MHHGPQEPLLSEICFEPACYYDTFGYKTTVIVTGGYVQMSYWRKDGCSAADEQLELLDPDDRVIRSVICKDSNAQWRLDINENIKLGQYKCRHVPTGEIQAPSAMNIDYRICRSG